jgi:hypothetical protein
MRPPLGRDQISHGSRPKPRPQYPSTSRPSREQVPRAKPRTSESETPSICTGANLPQMAQAHHRMGLCITAEPGRRYLLWVKSRHDALKSRCPLYPKSGHWQTTVGCPLCAKSRHSAFHIGYRRSSASMLRMVGRCRAISCQRSPSSRLAKTEPLLVPKYTPTGSRSSRPMACLRTVK